MAHLHIGCGLQPLPVKPEVGGSSQLLLVLLNLPQPGVEAAAVLGLYRSVLISGYGRWGEGEGGGGGGGRSSQLWQSNSLLSPAALLYS